MAYQYDEMGNVVGEYETEEEKRSRAAASQPVKQTITYNSDGTSEVTIKGTPEALSPINPNAPTLVNPKDDTYNRMLQVESGNRDYTKSGQPVTSPKGAMFASQVMPATAANPGYGVRPAQSQTPEEYNRVGREYYNALLQQFNGDTQKAAAAYNAGPGRVQQNIRQNNGQMNVSQLPTETQGYLQKIGNAVGNMIPSAQAGTVPQPMRQGQNARDDLMMRPVNPASLSQAPQPDSVINNQVAQYEAKQPSQYSLATGQGNEGLRVASATPVTSPVDTRLFDYYQKQQDNPQALISMGFADNENIPDWLKNRAKNRAAELITQQREMAAVKEKIPTMSESDIARALREKTTGGNYLKAALFGLLGMEQSALAEAAKLGIGKETMTQINGQPAMVKLSANGTPIEGYNAVTGKKLSPEELVTAAQFGTSMKGTEAEAGTYMDPSGKVAGNWVLERKPGGSQFRQVGTGKIATEEQANSLRKTGVQGTLGDQRARQIQEINLKLQGKGVEEQMRILSDYNKQLASNGYAIVQPSEVGLNVPQISGGASTGQAVSAPTSTAGTTSTTGTGTTATGTRPTAIDLEAQKTTAKEAAQEVGTDLGKVKANQTKAEQNADYLITKMNELVSHPGFETSVGRKGLSYGFGMAKEPLLEGTDASDWQSRFNEVKGQSFLQAIENLRGMGALSNLEGESATKAIQRMATSQSEKEFKAAAKDFQDIITRGIDRNRVKLGQPPLYGTPAASQSQQQAPASSQFKIISVTPGPR